MINITKEQRIWRECTVCSSRRVLRYELTSAVLNSTETFFLCEKCSKDLHSGLGAILDSLEG